MSIWASTPQDLPVSAQLLFTIGIFAILKLKPCIVTAQHTQDFCICGSGI